jgi:hypothetical protein
LILIKIEKSGHCFYCIYRDIIEYRDNFLDNNREMIFKYRQYPYELIKICAWHLHKLNLVLKYVIKICGI